jgi:proline iminopeptidase
MAKKMGKWLGIAVLLVLVSFLVLFIVNQPAFPIPATVQHDSSLPAVELEGYKFHFEERGDRNNPLLVGLHGGPGDDMESVRPLLRLSDEYHVILYDQRNSGLSQRTDEEVTLQEMYDDLTFIVNRYLAKEEKAILVGHSWGAMLASGWTVRNPDRVDRLILAEPGFLTKEAGTAFLKNSGGMKPAINASTVSLLISSWFESLHIRGIDGHEAKDYFMLRLMGHPDFKREDHPLGGYACPGSSFTIPDRRVGTAVSMAMQGRAFDKSTGECKVDMIGGYDPYPGKTLHIISECNTLIGIDHQKKFHIPLFPDSRTVIIKEAGHLMFTEKPEESLRAIREFLASDSVDDAAEAL